MAVQKLVDLIYHPAFILSIRMLLILLVIWSSNRIVGVLIHTRLAQTSLSETTRNLFITIIRACIFILGFLIFLETAGISITPLLASLGVGSVAVALALQDTLGNFFSGLYLMIDKPIRIGDFVQMEDGIEGFARKIGWRSTRIEQLGGRVVIIPNTKIATSRLINYDLIVREAAFGVNASVPYGTDLDKVEQLTLEVAREIQARVPGAVRTYEPSVRFSAFGDSTVNFSVNLRANHYVDNYLMKHEFIKALHKRFQKEGIKSPLPLRVRLEQAVSPSEVER